MFYQEDKISPKTCTCVFYLGLELDSPVVNLPVVGVEISLLHIVYQ